MGSWEVCWPIFLKFALCSDSFHYFVHIEYANAACERYQRTLVPIIAGLWAEIRWMRMFTYLLLSTADRQQLLLTQIRFSLDTFPFPPMLSSWLRWLFSLVGFGFELQFYCNLYTSLADMQIKISSNMRYFMNILTSNKSTFGSAFFRFLN